jgi:hypothetical protein
MNLQKHKKTIILLMLLTLPAFGLFACEMVFYLSGPEVSNQKVLPGSTLSLKQGELYSLKVEFTEDHRNCSIPAEDTLFLLDGSKWKPTKTSLNLLLLQETNWVENSKTLNTTVLEFKADKSGLAVLQILRDCKKGGYDEAFNFLVG